MIGPWNGYDLSTKTGLNRILSIVRVNRPRFVIIKAPLRPFSALGRSLASDHNLRHRFRRIARNTTLVHTAVRAFNGNIVIFFPKDAKSPTGAGSDTLPSLSV